MAQVDHRKELEQYKIKIDQLGCLDEPSCIEALKGHFTLGAADWAIVRPKAEALLVAMRHLQMKQGGIAALMQQYDLSHEEGVTLMCVAEAMLRIPDAATIDGLIQDKLGQGDWKKYIGQSHSPFVNATTWGLLLTGKLFKKNHALSMQAAESTWRRLFQRIGEPVLRQVMQQVMRQLGQHFVMAKSIEKSLKLARKAPGFYRHSYDMLGEEAETFEDASRYFADYQHALNCLVQEAKAQQLRPFHLSISIKLSALYPRYEYAKHQEAVPFLVERLLALVAQAKPANIAITIDAEEYDRRHLMLDIVQAVFSHSSTHRWPGFGFAVQSYTKSAMATIDWVIALAQAMKKPMLLRLVKGAYWDSEIKQAQQMGLAQYPVFTVKGHTDLSYLACAAKMIQAQDAIYCQFATHNALTVAIVRHWMGQRQDYEFQCLYGMGQVLYDDFCRQKENQHIACRIYAPIGEHAELLPYLVRRLLENGANTSFINQMMRKSLNINTLLRHPWDVIATYPQGKHPKIPLPCALYGVARMNSPGYDLSNPSVVAQFAQYLEACQLQGQQATQNASQRASSNPSNLTTVGYFQLDTIDDATEKMQQAHQAWPAWAAVSVKARADLLRQTADHLIKETPTLFALLVKEAGKTWQDAIDEIREAVDFLRFYAEQAESLCQALPCPGVTGEDNQWSLEPRGVLLCISPWNFPLAIFMGQVAAALVTGNVVMAKPATQTILIAQFVAKLFETIGLPRHVFHCIAGDRKIVQHLLTMPHLAGVMLTGSHHTARAIQQTLAARQGPILPLVAETGGQNIMIVDSSALAEQVVRDVVHSAFQSAGQRCSALRVLFLQSEVAEKIESMLLGALQTLAVKDPTALDTDLGPMIDQHAKQALVDHCAWLDQHATCLGRVKLDPQVMQQRDHLFFAPCIYRIPALDVLKDEVFGPILHIVHYKKSHLSEVIASINACGFGLTLGVHSRIDSTIQRITSQARVGNIYVNRDMVGAVVQTQPFGGMGMSGTGPKAGGPLYLQRLCVEKTVSTNTTAVGGNASLMLLSDD